MHLIFELQEINVEFFFSNVFFELFERINVSVFEFVVVLAMFLDRDIGQMDHFVLQVLFMKFELFARKSQVTFLEHIIVRFHIDHSPDSNIKLSMFYQ